MILYLISFFFYSADSWSVTGRDLLASEAPQHACEVRFLSENREVFSSCSGDVISDRQVLLAQHCVDGLSSIESYAETEVTCLGGTVVRKVEDDKTIVRENYSSDKPGNDIAILQVNQDFRIEPVILPENTIELDSYIRDLKEGNIQCAIFGYGFNTKSKPSSTGKIHGANIGVSQSILELSLKRRPGGLPENMKIPEQILPLTWYRGGIQPGDSGGGAYCKNEHNRWVRVGTSVFGFAKEVWQGNIETLGPHLDWINDNTGKSTALTGEEVVSIRKIQNSNICGDLGDCLEVVDHESLLLAANMTEILSELRNKSEEFKEKNLSSDLDSELATLSLKLSLALEECLDLRRGLWKEFEGIDFDVAEGSEFFLVDTNPRVLDKRTLTQEEADRWVFKLSHTERGNAIGYFFPASASPELDRFLETRVSATPQVSLPLSSLMPADPRKSSRRRIENLQTGGLRRYQLIRPEDLKTGDNK